jgi:hypothetical protein
VYVIGAGADKLVDAVLQYENGEIDHRGETTHVCVRVCVLCGGGDVGEEGRVRSDVQASKEGERGREGSPGWSCVLMCVLMCV